MKADFSTIESATNLFWERLTKTDGGCWIFNGKSRSGSLSYGAIRIPKIFGFGRKQVLAHRFAFFLANGYWPENTRHTCDVPLCCNPSHLIAGTQAQNIDDCISRGRARNGNIKLNPVIWQSIRESALPATMLAEMYGVHEAHVRKIRRGKSGLVYRP